ncbi:N-acetylmuramoyl-L-alanine amidase [Trichocoleus sp. FACHB-591]|uniref:peptidoglycan recognition protein family protein n=1 Tax=Trichocoleus sp. FACHB-591 TaxID=2692872 RepID=UPI00168236CF|nr:N-acetylmuramoyl-L-alanine amidase [Trichocoleus sp. FACHB-591]MBD2098361.1 N-acetylmuramoyl-L-alanine amidase [Trichocoleus sp. FACHB-591]
MPFTAKVISTAEWGADKPKDSPFSITTPRFIVIHHTVTPNPPNARSHGTLQGAKQFALDTQRDMMSPERGFSDSGHNFLNTTGGLILEGRHGSLDAVKRGLCVQSAHTAQDPGKLAGGNSSPGIENEGNFMEFHMGQKQWDSLVELCASLCKSCKISPKNIRGHREFSQTICPGDWLFSQLPRLRKEVASRLELQTDPKELENDTSDEVLKLGSTGLDVTKLQQHLREKGFKPGAADGFFGENTQAAVIAFQKSAKLVADGSVGPKTRTALGLS